MRWSVDLLQWPLQTTDPYADFGVSVALFGIRTQETRQKVGISPK